MKKEQNEKCDFYSVENLLFQCFHFKINRWHGIRDKINKDEKYTSVTKMVTKCQYNLLVNIKIHSHTTKICHLPHPKNTKMQQMRIKYSVVSGDSSSNIPVEALLAFCVSIKS